MTRPVAIPRAVLSGDGTVVNFPFSFIVNEKEDLVVEVFDLVADTRVLLSDSVFTVTGLGDANGGFITYPLGGTPLSSDNRISIRRVVPYDQNLNIESSAFNPNSFEGELDSIVEQTQQLAEGLDRTVQIPAYEDGPIALPGVESRRNKFFAFDNLGNPRLVEDGATVNVDSSSLVFATLNEFAAENVPSTVSAVLTLGYNTAGDLGGAPYRRVSSEPSHEGKVQTLDGAWWELSVSRANPEMFGARADGSSEGAILQNLLDWVGDDSDNRSAWFPQTYITNLSLTLDVSGVSLYGNGYDGGVIRAGTSFPVDGVMLHQRGSQRILVQDLTLEGFSSTGTRPAHLFKSEIFNGNRPATPTLMNCNMTDSRDHLVVFGPDTTNWRVIGGFTKEPGAWVQAPLKTPLNPFSSSSVLERLLG